MFILQEIRFIWRIIGLFVVMLFISSGGITMYTIEQGMTLINPELTYKKLAYTFFVIVLIYWFFACVNILVDIPSTPKYKKDDKNVL